MAGIARFVIFYHNLNVLGHRTYSFAYYRALCNQENFRRPDEPHGT